MATKQPLPVHVGTILKNSTELHDIEYEVSFSIYINTFFKRMISEELLGKEKGVRIYSEDFYKGLIFLDYFCGVIEGNYAVRDNLVTLSKKLRELEKEKKLDNELSYLRLEAVIGEAGLYAQDHEPDYYSNKATVKSIEERYTQKHIPVDTSTAIRADPYYEALGLMVCDMISDANKPLVENVSSRVELQAFVCCDLIINYLQDKTATSRINDALSQKEYLKASLQSIEALAQYVDKDKLSDQIDKYFSKAINDANKKTHS